MLFENRLNVAAAGFDALDPAFNNRIGGCLISRLDADGVAMMRAMIIIVMLDAMPSTMSWWSGLLVLRGPEMSTNRL